MNLNDFIAKWQKVQLTERSAAQQHFLDLCEVLDHPKPAAADPTGESFTFEKGAAKHGGGDGWADVWKRGFFGWEYKGKHKNLDAAYEQLLKYREALENPPLLVVCDMDRIVVHTNFTGTRTAVHDLSLADLGSAASLEILHAVFHAPDKLKPGTTSEAITAKAASQVAALALKLRERGFDPRRVARFLDRMVFSFFAEDIGLLPGMLLSRLLEKTRHQAELFPRFAGGLFESMATGGFFDLTEIRRFNGNLFDSGEVLDLTHEEIEGLYQASRLDWSAVDPSILGTLFERGMDPDKRAQLGAHYTSRQDIETLIEPVVMAPLRREWAEAKQFVQNLLATGKKKPTGDEAPPTGPKLRKAVEQAGLFVRRFHHRLAQVKVLDPACGSGNFLFVTLQKLKDLEKEVIVFAMDQSLPGLIPLVGPWQLYGVEINSYAHELAQMTVWIGYLQWTRNNGFGHPDDPVLRPMDNFQCKDAILDLTDPENPKEPEWPRVDFVVGNPPFLGDKLMRGVLGDEYVEQLRELYSDRVPGQADLCCYWFEKAREEIVQGRCARAGLLGTQGIRGGASRRVLDRIKSTGDIFFAVSDRHWILEGANVHISMVGFDTGLEKERTLDGARVPQINPDLTTGSDLTVARRLASNTGISFQGPVKVGHFEIEDQEALEVLRAPNPTGAPNSDVVRPWMNGKSIARRTAAQWIIDFHERTLSDAAKFELPFDHVSRFVRPKREKNRRERRGRQWWLHGETVPALRQTTRRLERLLVTPRVGKHRVFVWVDAVTLPDSALVAVARRDYFCLGVLSSRLHEVWSLRKGTQLREKESGFRYTPKSTFETFPFPRFTPAQEIAIAEAAGELDRLRSAWLNPPEWSQEEVLEFPGSVDGPWARYVHEPDGRGIGTVHYPRLVPKDADSAAKLKTRTLTNLYNQRPAWLDHAHKGLDEAVFAAYGWSPGLTDDALLARLLALNLERAAEEDSE